jgi:hypothetical protein
MHIRRIAIASVAVTLVLLAVGCGALVVQGSLPVGNGTRLVLITPLNDTGSLSDHGEYLIVNVTPGTQICTRRIREECVATGFGWSQRVQLGDELPHFHNLRWEGFVKPARLP